MIKVNRDGAKITLDVEAGNGWAYPFSWTASGGDDHAGFVAGAIRENIAGHLASIRRQAYERGWSDAKAKRRKESWFSRFWS